jgi:YesN/AraC family two-component response regulator
MYKLLIVEDEGYIRNSLKDSVLSFDMGFDIIKTAADGIEALNIIEKEGPFHVVLSDIRMPNMSGLDLARHIEKYFPEVHFALFSAYNDFLYAQEAIRYGVKAYILKPIKDYELKRILDKIVSEISSEARFKKNTLVLKQLIHGIVPETINEELPLFAEKKYYRVAVCSVNDKEGLVESKYDPPTKEFCAENSVPYLWYYDNIVLLLNSGTDLGQEETRNVLNGYFEHIGSPQDAVLGVGDTYASLESLKSSYSEAIYAASCRYFGKYPRIIFNQNLHKQDYTALDDEITNSIVENIIKSTFLYDYKSVEKYIGDFFHNTLSRGSFSIFHVQTKCLEILFDLNYEMRDRGYTKHTIDKNKIIEAVKSKESIVQLRQWFLSAVNDVITHMTQTSESSIDYIVRAQKYIERHYPSKLTLEQVAEQVHVSPVYFSSAFKKKFGINFTDYINDVRINAAKNILLNPNIRVKDIYHKIGYSDYSYFCRVFKKKTGVSPLKYRTQKLLEQ